MATLLGNLGIGSGGGGGGGGILSNLLDPVLDPVLDPLLGANGTGSGGAQPAPITDPDSGAASPQPIAAPAPEGEAGQAGGSASGGGGGLAPVLAPVSGAAGTVLPGAGGSSAAGQIETLLKNAVPGGGDLVGKVLSGLPATGGDAADAAISGLLSPLLDPLAGLRVRAGETILLDAAPRQGGSFIDLDLSLIDPAGALLGVDGTLLGLNASATLGGPSLIDVALGPRGGASGPAVPGTPAPDGPGKPVVPGGPGTPGGPGGPGGPARPEPGGPGAPADASAYQVSLIGTDQRDTFIVGEKSTFVAGRGELDTVIYLQSASEFHYRKGVDSIAMTDARNTDFLSSVERIKFFDGTMALDVGLGENAGVAYRLYAAALDRTPDSGGLKYWIDRIDRGDSRVAIAESFVNSAEFKAGFGTDLSNRQFVETLYRNVLDRAAEAAGLDFWTGQLDHGASRGSVLASIAESAENLRITAAEIGDFLFIA